MTSKHWWTRTTRVKHIARSRCIFGRKPAHSGLAADKNISSLLWLRNGLKCAPNRESAHYKTVVTLLDFCSVVYFSYSLCGMSKLQLLLISGLQVSAAGIPFSRVSHMCRTRGTSREIEASRCQFLVLKAMGKETEFWPPLAHSAASITPSNLNSMITPNFKSCTRS